MQAPDLASLAEGLASAYKTETVAPGQHSPEGNGQLHRLFSFTYVAERIPANS